MPAYPLMASPAGLARLTETGLIRLDGASVRLAIRLSLASPKCRMACICKGNTLRAVRLAWTVGDAHW